MKVRDPEQHQLQIKEALLLLEHADVDKAVAEFVLEAKGTAGIGGGPGVLRVGAEDATYAAEYLASLAEEMEEIASGLIGAAERMEDPDHE